MEPGQWMLKRVLPAAASAIILSLVLMLALPGVFLTGPPLLLLIALVALASSSALLFPLVLREKRKSEIDDQLHLFIIRIGVLSLSSSTRKSIYEHAARDRDGSSAITWELEKVRVLSGKWKISIPEALRIVSKKTPSSRLGDFMERMAYAIETDEDPKAFFRNEQEAALEEFKSRYSNTLDRIEVVREVYISMVSVTMFLNVMLVILSMMVGINHYLISFLIVFIFILVEIILWIVVDQTMPGESIWFGTGASIATSAFIRRYRITLALALISSSILAIITVFIGPSLEHALIHLAVIATPLLVPGIVILKEERTITRRDEAFGAFIRILGTAAESKGGIPLSVIKRLRWHDFGALTEQVRNLYDRLETRIDQEGAWNMFVRESRSELISQFMNTYLDGVRSGGNPKDVSSMVSTYFTSLASLRKRRYLMADNFTAILYGLTLFISGGLFLIEGVVEEMLKRLESLSDLSGSVENLQGLVLLKDVANLEIILMIAILMVVMVHILFSVESARRFRGSNRMIALIHLPGLLWCAAISAFLARFAVGSIL